MKKGKGVLLRSAVILSLFSLLTKGIGMLFRIYLSARIGAEGMGLYALVLSVYTLFSTFATAGLTMSVSRLVAEKMQTSVADTGFEGEKMLRSGLVLAAVTGGASCVAMLLSTRVFAFSFLADGRTLQPLYALAFSLPFMAVTSCLKGYFIAVRRVSVPGSNQIIEQTVKVASAILFLNVFCEHSTDIGAMTTAVAASVTLGEAVSFFYLSGMRLLRRPGGHGRLPLAVVTGVALPIASGTYVTAALHMVESVLIPWCFMQYGGDRGEALAEFGLVRGMVIPVLFFPFAFLSAVVSILIPEISRLNTPEKRRARDVQISRAVRVTVLFGIGAGMLFFTLPEELGMLFYHTADAARPMRYLAAVTPMMYIETVCDGILKGIGEQMFTMKVSIVNSVLRIAAIFLLLPRMGGDGYLWLLIGSNTFSFALCAFRLHRKAKISLHWLRTVLIPSGYGAAICFCAHWAAGCGGTVLTAGLLGCGAFLSGYVPLCWLLQKRLQKEESP